MRSRIRKTQDYEGGGKGATSPRRHRVLGIVRRVVVIILILVIVALNVAAARFGSTLDSFVSNDKVDVSEADLTARQARGERLARQVEGEGIVLLRNDDNVLPLASDTDKVNVFGWASTQWVTSGSGSGGVSGDTTSLLDALSDAGIAYNEDLATMYRRFRGSRPYLSEGSLMTTEEQFCRLYEPDVSNAEYYTQDLLDEAKAYSDTALVVISRVCGESVDCPTKQYRVTDGSGKVTEDDTRGYLELSPEEEDLLAYVGANYDKVIVLVNSTNTMELGQLETIPGIDAALLVGATGTSGAKAIPDVLTGATNPSGRTADTYAYDFSTAPSYANAGLEGEGTYSNAKGAYPNDGTLNVNVSTNPPYDAVHYVDYAEGLYVGYRWYETADAEGFWDGVSNEHGEGYGAVVQYPFGYGLSYTSFSWEVTDVSPSRRTSLARDTELSWTVRVTNTGQVSGRDVVQLYCTPPYTRGEIEKPSSTLVGFAKTRLLGPGESQDVTISLNADDLASYDWRDANANGFVGYELEAGPYLFELKRDAHTVDDCDGARTTYRVMSDIHCDTDLSTGAEVTNRFTGDDAPDGVSVDGGTTDEGIVYLSRADFAGTYPTGVRRRPMSERLRKANLYDASAQDTGSAVADEPARAAGLVDRRLVGRDGALTQEALQLGMNYTDDEWSDVLSTVSLEDQKTLYLHGYCSSAAVSSMGKPRTKELDGPSQIGSFHQMSYGEGYPNATVLAQTWDVQLAHDLGQQVGMECADLGIDGWYAPSTNIHRSPLGGRNYEYYSEDPLLAGMLCSNVQLGSREAGTFCYIKHLAVNNQESYRDGLYTWLTEQTLRELYLRPFRIAVEHGGATGFMTSYNRIGGTWAGGNKALLTDVLRGEWNFQGSVITDYCDHKRYMNADQALLAGGDLYMDGVFRNGSLAGDATTEGYREALDRSTKDVTYIWLEARTKNALYNERARENGETQLIRPVVHQGTSYVVYGLAIIDAAGAIGATAWGVSKVRKHRARKAGSAQGKE